MLNLTDLSINEAIFLENRIMALQDSLARFQVKYSATPDKDPYQDCLEKTRIVKRINDKLNSLNSLISKITHDEVNMFLLSIVAKSSFTNFSLREIVGCSTDLEHLEKIKPHIRIKVVQDVIDEIGSDEGFLDCVADQFDGEVPEVTPENVGEWIQMFKNSASVTLHYHGDEVSCIPDVVIEEVPFLQLV